MYPAVTEEDVKNLVVPIPSRPIEEKIIQLIAEQRRVLRKQATYTNKQKINSMKRLILKPILRMNIFL